MRLVMNLSEVLLESLMAEGKLCVWFTVATSTLEFRALARTVRERLALFCKEGKIRVRNKDWRMTMMMVAVVKCCSSDMFW